jgi:hypothetical protein
LAREYLVASVDLAELPVLAEAVRLAALRASLGLEVLADLVGAAQAQEAPVATGDLVTAASEEAAAQEALVVAVAAPTAVLATAALGVAEALLLPNQMLAHNLLGAGEL